jgi:endonuclease-3
MCILFFLVSVFFMTKKERFTGVINFFKTHMPDAKIELNYENPFQLLVAVILSAQCTDKRVNLVTPRLFQTFPTAEFMAHSTQEEIFGYIKSISYPNSKSKYLVEMSKMLLQKFNNKIPESPEQMQLLPGVGRKTAHVVAFNLYNAPTLAVDTHVFRVSKRLGLVEENAKTPLAVERQLTAYLPQESVGMTNHWFVLHGRYVCVAQNPKCSNCGIRDFCKYFSEKNSKL